MTTGLLCYDANGNLTFQLTDYLPRVLGSIPYTGNVDGSLTDTNLSGGTGFAILRSSSGYKIPRVYVSGNTVYWQWSAAYYQGADGYILYGLL